MGIDRPDWGDGSHKTYDVVPTEQPTSSDEIAAEMESWPDTPAVRNNAGQFTPAALQHWEREGGYDQNLAKAQAVYEDLIAAAPDLEPEFEALPKSIQLKALDSMRLGLVKGRGLAAVAAFEDRLTSSERAIYRRWVDGLHPDDRAALIRYFDR